MSSIVSRCARGVRAAARVTVAPHVVLPRFRTLPILCAELHHHCFSSSATPAAHGDQQPAAGGDAEDIPGARIGSEMMVILYTCKVCETRSARRFSKAAYTSGLVLLRCPGCANLHLIADHLGYFEEPGANIEDILKQQGQTVRRGSIGPAGMRLAAAPAAPAATGGGATGASGAVAPASPSPPQSQSHLPPQLQAQLQADANVIELSSEDVRVLRSRTKSIRRRADSDGNRVVEEEMAVLSTERAASHTPQPTVTATRTVAASGSETGSGSSSSGSSSDKSGT